MNYQDYSSDDFAADAYFQKWVQDPDVDTRLFWENWLLQNPDKQLVIEDARKLLTTFRFQEPEYSPEFVNTIWQNIEEKINSQDNTRTLPAFENKYSGSFFKLLSKVAATLLVLIVAVSLIYRQFIPDTISLTTANNQIKTIVLPDSSRVTLNANSTLTYQKSWNKRQIREVWLTGEGFFQVRKKFVAGNTHGVKFIVHVNLMDVEVLGTQFNVNTRNGKSQVVLNSGKVKLSNPQENNAASIIMQPGDLVERTSPKSDFFKKVVNPNLYSSWQTQQFEFKATPVAEIVSVLKDTYGWNIQVRDPQVGKKTFSSTVPVNKPDVLLRLLAESFQVSIQRKGNTVIIGQ